MKNFNATLATFENIDHIKEIKLNIHNKNAKFSEGKYFLKQRINNYIS